MMILKLKNIGNIEKGEGGEERENYVEAQLEKIRKGKNAYVRWRENNG